MSVARLIVGSPQLHKVQDPKTTAKGLHGKRAQWGRRYRLRGTDLPFGKARRLSARHFLLTEISAFSNRSKIELIYAGRISKLQARTTRSRLIVSCLKCQIVLYLIYPANDWKHEAKSRIQMCM